MKSAGNAVIPTFPTRWSHGLQHLRHKRPTLAFTSESGYALAFAQRIAHTGLHAETGAFRTGPLSLPSDCFTRCGNPAWPGGRTANFAPFGSRSRVLPKNAESLRDSDALMRVAVPRRRSPAGLRDLFRFCRNCGLYTLGSPRKIAHKGTHAEIGGVLGGGAITSTRAARSRTSPGRVSERQTLPLLGLGREVLSKNAESLRNSDALMRVAVPQASRPRWAA